MKIKSRILMLILVLAMCCSMLATTAFAYAEDQDPESETTSQETTAPEEEETEVPPVQTTPVVAEEGSGFSEDGNLITRDLLFDKNTNKQFITVQTRNGEIFYIIIDYDKPTDEDGDQYETYFLNMVDEADIQALLEEAGIVATCSCADKCTAGQVNTSCEICKKNMTECVGTEKVPETETVEPTEPSDPVENPSEQGNSMGILIVVLIVAVGGGLAYFLLKKKKPDPKTKGKTDLDDYDYGIDDDDEYADFEAYEEEEDK
jgi:flagellar basal body-associated protein FliL